MNKPLPKILSKRITIYLSLERSIFKGYFNNQDPSPVYKRQISQDFAQYIVNSMQNADRNSVVKYKISYSGEHEKQFAEPLIFAVRRHFSETRTKLTGDFEKFKRRTYSLLFFSVLIVMTCHWILPLLLKGKEDVVHSGFSNSLDVFSWVILWKPIDRLIFYWNPYLKDISQAAKLEKAEYSVVEIED